jgi:hypothetical protein
MSSHKSGNATANESVAKRPHISVTSAETVEVIRRKEDGQSCNIVHRI